jgi:outer membrane protein TolC
VEVDNALADLETARAAVVQAELAARAATELRDEVTQRFSYGLASGLEQADAAVSAFESQAALARRRLDLNSAQLRLSAALGHWPAGIHPESQSQK